MANRSDNYPPGVSGNEPYLTGDDFEGGDKIVPAFKLPHGSRVVDAELVVSREVVLLNLGYGEGRGDHAVYVDGKQTLRSTPAVARSFFAGYVAALLDLAP